MSSSGRFIRELARDVPVVREVDVLVAGGGTAGWIAGLAAARTGADTLVLERLNVLGGNLTGGIMGTAWTFNDQEHLVVEGLPLEFADRMIEIHATVPGDIARDAFVNYDTEMAKYVMAEMYREEPHLEVFFYTWVSDVIMNDGDPRGVHGVIIETKQGRQAILAKTIVDATGDADVAFHAGASFRNIARADMYPVSLLAKFAGVDVERTVRYYDEHPDRVGNFTAGQQYPGLHVFRLTGMLEGKELRPEHEYLRDWMVLLYQTPRPGELILNMSSATNVDATRVDQLSQAELLARQRHLHVLEVLREHLPGFEQAYISTSGQALGVRETRRIVGLYTFTREDIRSGALFPDAIASYHAQLSVHTADGKDVETEPLLKGTVFEVPYRALVPDVGGVIVAGRSLSADDGGITSVRNMTCIMAIGQGAGVAAALAAREGITPANLDISQLRRELLRQNVYLESEHQGVSG